MTTLTADDVHCAIETLETSYTYDPPERWLPSYSALKDLRGELLGQLKPYRWIKFVFLIVALIVLAGLGVAFVRAPVNSFQLTGISFIDSFILMAVWFLPAWLIAFGAWLATRVAANKQPLVKLLPSISAATARFHSIVRDYKSGSTDGAT